MPPLKTREEFILQFADWLDTPELRAQRMKDDPEDHRVKTYFHWIDRGVAFYFLDSATADEFDAAQLRWFERSLAKDLADPSVLTIVAGMHKALPESISAGHSMNESPAGTETGRRVYADLLRARDEAHKHVYVLASHSHYFMDGIFNTEYWKQHGGVLPGWIVGTGGARRYALPPNSADAHIAVSNVYGALLGTVTRRRNQLRVQKAGRERRSGIGNRSLRRGFRALVLRRKHGSEVAQASAVRFRVQQNRCAPARTAHGIVSRRMLHQRRHAR